MYVALKHGRRLSPTARLRNVLQREVLACVAQPRRNACQPPCFMCVNLASFSARRSHFFVVCRSNGFAASVSAEKTHCAPMPRVVRCHAFSAALAALFMDRVCSCFLLSSSTPAYHVIEPKGASSVFLRDTSRQRSERIALIRRPVCHARSSSTAN